MTDDLDFDEETTELPEGADVDALRNAPVDVIICNHIFHLLQLATLHLADTPPRLAEAQLLIDTVAAIIEAVGTRLGKELELLREALIQIRLAFVRASTGQEPEYD